MTVFQIKEELNKLKENSFKKFQNTYIPSANKFYGTRTIYLNQIVKNIKDYDLNLVGKLWKDDYFEEKIIGCKLLPKLSNNPEKLLKFIEKLSLKIGDWAVCDTLGTQGIKIISKTHQQEVYNLALKLSTKKDFWQRRLALVFMIELNRRNFDKNKIKKLISKLKNDEEYYVKKAIIWLENELKNN